MLSISMAPKDTGSIFFSFLICLDAVPEDTREWNPDTAPQAIVTKRIGNIYCPSTLNPLKEFRLQEGLEINTPAIAATIINTSR